MPKADAQVADFIGTPPSETPSDTETKVSTPEPISAPASDTPASLREETSPAPKTSKKTAVDVVTPTDLPVAETVAETKPVAKVSAATKAIKEVPIAPLAPRLVRTGRATSRLTEGAPRMNDRMGERMNGRSADRNDRMYDRNDNRNDSYSNDMREDSRDTRPRITIPERDAPTVTIKGILDTSRDGHGVLRGSYSGGDMDAYISQSQIRRFKLRAGDMIEGPGREPKENERYWGLLQVETVNGHKADELAQTDRVKFHSLTPVYPDSQIKLETGEEPLSLRIIDMIAPIGKGQRSLIASPPKAGKTTLLKDIATGIAANYPEIHVMAVLVGERPEEVTDIRRHIERITKGDGEVAASNFDEPAEDQCRVAELALERAKRLVEMGQDVVILLDSITRLARAYNLSIPTSGRTLSGGFDPAALFPPKKFFGAARNFEVAGSLTIIGTALVDTGSRMDDLIYEEFKGTGNQEVTLDRRLTERRIYPAIDVQRSGTRRDDLLIDSMTYQSIITLQRMLDMLDKDERTVTLIEQMKRTKTNKEFLASLKAA